MARAFVIDAARTPFGRYRGALSGVRVDDLAALPLIELTTRHGPIGSDRLDPTSIEEVFYGSLNGAGEENRDVARMATLLAGLPVNVPGVTVNRLCGSSGEALVQAARAIRANDAELVIAGGVEGASRAPFVIPRPEEALPDRMDVVSTVLGWRLVNPKMAPEWTNNLGKTTEDIAIELGITRSSMDFYALRSHRRAAAAWDAGVHEGFAFPVVTPDGTLRRDESVRADLSADRLSKLPSAYTESGPLTAGNSSPLSDGAMAALVGTEEHAERLRVTPLGEILGSSTVAVDPQRWSLGAVPAIHDLLDRFELDSEAVNLWEINEAFAAVVLSVLHHLPGVDRELVNVHGGALAYGHPLGASMLRTVIDLCRHLRRRGGGVGVAAASIGVGQGTAILVRA